MSRKLSEKETRFLEVLFEEAEGDPVKAKKLAGYSVKTPTAQIVNQLQDEIFEATKKFISQSSTKAAYTLFKVMDEDDIMLGAKEKMSAAKDLLDRAGLVKTEKVEVTAKEPVFILPSKQVDED